MITFLLLIVLLGAFVLFMKYAVNHQWLCVRLLALSTSLCLGGEGLILWVTTDVSEIWILEICTFFAVFVGLLLLSMPVTAPEIEKKLNLKW